MTQTLYLLFIRQPETLPEALDLHGDGTPIAPGLFLVRSTLTRSQFYHRIKWQLPDKAGLLVAPLSADPKFKGMDPGTLDWLRNR